MLAPSRICSAGLAPGRRWSLGTGRAIAPPPLRASRLVSRRAAAAAGGRAQPRAAAPVAQPQSTCSERPPRGLAAPLPPRRRARGLRARTPATNPASDGGDAGSTDGGAAAATANGTGGGAPGSVGAADDSGEVTFTFEALNASPSAAEAAAAAGAAAEAASAAAEAEAAAAAAAAPPPPPVAVLGGDPDVPEPEPEPERPAAGAGAAADADADAAPPAPPPPGTHGGPAGRPWNLGTVPPHWWEDVGKEALKWGALAAVALLALPSAFGYTKPKRGAPSYNGWQYTLSRSEKDAAAEAASCGAAAAGAAAAAPGDSILEGIQDWFIGRTAYSVQQLSTAHVVVKILILMSFAAPIISGAALAYQRASGMSYGEALYKCYALVWRVPGIGLAKEPTFESYVVANVVFLVGVFTFAIMLGIVSDEIKQGFRNARNGNYPVRTSGHVLLLNWNSQSPAILRQIAAAQSASGRGSSRTLNAFLQGSWSGRQQVVILADKPKAQMDLAVFETLRDRGAKLEVHTRQGNPFKLSDLRKVAANQARTILLLHPEASQGSAEAIKASAAMCLTAMEGAKNGQQRVVMQIPSEAPPAQASYLTSLVNTARIAGRDFQVAALPERKIMHRLVAQTAAQPGLFTCWLDILTLHGLSPQFVCKPLPSSLVGKSYEEIRRAFTDAVVLGFIPPAPGAKVILNAVSTAEVPAGSKLVLLGRNEHARAQLRSTLYADAAGRAAERLKQERTYKSRPRNIIVAGWPQEGVPELMSGFGDLTHSGSVVTFILESEPPATWPSREGNCRFNFIVAGSNPTQPKFLMEAGIKSADTVVVGQGAGSGNETETDAKVLASLMQVQDAVVASKRKSAPHVVAPIRRYATSKLAHQYFDTLLRESQLQAAAAEQEAAAAAAAGGAGAAEAKAALEKANAACDVVIKAPEFINTSDVISAVLTQVVAESAYDAIMRELLFSTHGQELYLRNPAAFNIAPGQVITFAELAESVRLTRQTALGYIRAGRLAVLAPDAAHQIVFTPEDRIVVIAEEF